MLKSHQGRDARQRRRDGGPGSVVKATHAGVMGYPGETGGYLPAAAVNAARNASGLPLEYYANLDASWFTPSQYFTDVATATCHKCCTANVRRFNHK